MKTSSLTRDYFIFSVVIVAIIIVAMFFIALTFYKSEQKNNAHTLSTEAKQIEKSISESFDYANRISTYMGKQIVEHGADDLDYILDLFRKTSAMQYRVQGLFSWSLFDWVDANNLQLLNSKNGISESPPDMSHRDYSWKSRKYPWTLKLSKPAIGHPSGKWVIPAGVGITNKENKYLGSIVVGFNVEELTSNVLSKLSDKTVSFVILDNNYRMIMQSSDNNLDPASSYYKKLFSQKSPFNDKAGVLSFESEGKSIKYSQYRKIDGYNYVVLTGFNKNIISKSFYQTLLPRLVEFAGLGLFFLVMLYIFRRYIISPVTKLVDAADKISHGVKIKKVPRGTSKETTILAKQLVSVMRYMNKEKRHKEQLEKAKLKVEELIKISNESRSSKEEFLKQMREKTKHPLNAIMRLSEEIMIESHGKIPVEYKDKASEIFNNGYHIANMITSVLYKTYIEPSKVISSCTDFYKEKAYTSGINYKVRIKENLPSINVDEVRFRQIIIATINHSLKLTPENEKIIIEAFDTNENNVRKLIIKILDTGFCADERFRINNIDNIGPQGISRNSDGTDLVINDIKKLLKLHEGSLQIKINPDKGNIFTIEIPYKNDNLYSDINNQSKCESNKDNVVLLFNK